MAQQPPKTHRQLQFNNWIPNPAHSKKRKGDSPHERLVIFPDVQPVYQSPYPQSPPPTVFVPFVPPTGPVFTAHPVPQSQPQQWVQPPQANIYAPVAMSIPVPVPQIAAAPQPPQQQQQQQVQPPQPQPQPQADEWTEVTTKSKSKAKRRRKSPPPAASTTKTPTPKVRNPPSKNVTLAKIQIDFNSKMKTWQASDCRKKTLSLLEKIQPSVGWAIDKAVCLGSGSFSRENGECRKRSMWQFVVFFDLVRHLQKVGKRDFEMYVQEPQYTETDKAFLQTLRIKVLEVQALPDPVPEGNVNEGGLGSAVEHLGWDTFLYEPFMDMNEAMLSEITFADVGLYIGSSVRGLMGRWGAVGDLARAFEGCHGIYQFPRFEEDPNVLEGLGIYWKPEVDDD